MLSALDHLGENPLPSSPKGKGSSLEAGREAQDSCASACHTLVQHARPASRAPSALEHRGEMSRFLLHGVIVNKATSLPSSSDVTCGSKPWKGQDRKGRAGHRVETRSFPELRFQTGHPDFLMLAQREQGVPTRRGGWPRGREGEQGHVGSGAGDRTRVPRALGWGWGCLPRSPVQLMSSSGPALVLCSGGVWRRNLSEGSYRREGER